MLLSATLAFEYEATCLRAEHISAAKLSEADGGVLSSRIPGDDMVLEAAVSRRGPMTGCRKRTGLNLLDTARGHVDCDPLCAGDCIAGSGLPSDCKGGVASSNSRSHLPLVHRDRCRRRLESLYADWKAGSFFAKVTGGDSSKPLGNWP